MPARHSFRRPREGGDPYAVSPMFWIASVCLVGLQCGHNGCARAYGVPACRVDDEVLGATSLRIGRLCVADDALYGGKARRRARSISSTFSCTPSAHRSPARQWKFTISPASVSRTRTLWMSWIAPSAAKRNTLRDLPTGRARHQCRRAIRVRAARHGYRPRRPHRTPRGYCVPAEWAVSCPG